MFDGNWRGTVDRALVPIGASLRRTGISADVITVTGIVMAGAAAVAIGTGNLSLGLLFLILTGVPDALDGAVAKASGTASVRGAFFDSVSDRLTDALLRRRRLALFCDSSRSDGHVARCGDGARDVGVLRAGQGRVAGLRRHRGHHGAR